MQQVMAVCLYVGVCPCVGVWVVLWLWLCGEYP